MDGAPGPPITLLCRVGRHENKPSASHGGSAAKHIIVTVRENMLEAEIGTVWWWSPRHHLEYEFSSKKENFKELWRGGKYSAIACVAIYFLLSMSLR